MDSLPNSSYTDEQNPRFQPYQIVCLEHADARLHAEVVQLVAVKRSCWVHPLVLILRSPMASTPFELFGQDGDPTTFTLHDLRQGADLVWPTILFRAALDTEVIPIFACLYQMETPHAEKDQKTWIAHQSLTQFIRQLWQAHTDVFSD